MVAAKSSGRMRRNDLMHSINAGLILSAGLLTWLMPVMVSAVTVDNIDHGSGTQNMEWAATEINTNGGGTVTVSLGVGDVGGGTFTAQVAIVGANGSPAGQIVIHHPSSSINGLTATKIDVYGNGSTVTDCTVTNIEIHATNSILRGTMVMETCAVYGENNTIGGADTGHRNFFVGTHLDSGERAMVVYGAGHDIRNNHFGLNSSGTPVANVRHGLQVEEATNVTVSYNTFVNCSEIPVRLRGADGCQFLNNYVGVTAADTVISNGWLAQDSSSGDWQGAVSLIASSNVLIQGNVIGGNARHGIDIDGAFGCAGLRIEGNFIGVLADGTSVVANAKSGIYAHELYNAAGSPAVIGGSNSVAANVISGNGRYGVEIGFAAAHVNILGNKIGTDGAGTAARANTLGGLWLRSMSNCVVGAGNVIAGNSGPGITINNGNVETVSDLRIQGNRIGLKAAGYEALPNQGAGIYVNMQDISGLTHGAVLIGGTADEAERNIIFGNAQAGIHVYCLGSNAFDFTIAGNSIASNGYDGIEIERLMGGGVVSNNLIGVLPNDTLKGNGRNGINLGTLFCSNVTVVANTIMHNQQHGIRVGGTVSATSFHDTNTRIGGGDPGEANIIGSNTLYGIYVCASDVLIQGNRIGFIPAGARMYNTQGGIFVMGYHHEEWGATPNRSITIGGEESRHGNIILGSGDGITIVSNTAADYLVAANVIGFDPDQAYAPNVMNIGLKLGNGSGAKVGAEEFSALYSGNRIGGTTNAGIYAQSVTNAGFYANQIGSATNWSGVYMTNLGVGVELVDCDGVTFGSTTHGNNVSGNSSGGMLVRRSDILPPAGGISTVPGEYKGNLIGVNYTSQALPNGGFGLRFVHGFKDQVGGELEMEWNTISGNNGVGLDVAIGVDMTVLGNRVGTDHHATFAVPNNGDGMVFAGCMNLRVGSATGSFPNVISGNSGHGIHIKSESHSLADQQQALFAGNIIGLGNNKLTALGNAGHGIFVANAVSNTIGMAGANGGNWIACNGGHGVLVTGVLARATIVQYNRIGQSSGGDRRANTGDGIRVVDTPDMVIGADRTAGGNIICANTGNGISLLDEASDASVYGNFIGVQADGSTGLGNAGHGILVAGAGGHVLGRVTGTGGNVIGDNGGCGVVISNSTQNVIAANYIGTRLNGTGALGNVEDGVKITQGTYNTIQDNVVGGSGVNGITVSGIQSRENTILANHIGVFPGLVQSLANAGIGVDIFGAAETDVGGLQRTDANYIFNNREGIRVSAGNKNSLRGNIIHASVTEGIVLTNNGNDAQSAPIITGAALGSVIIAGYLQSASSAEYRLEFFLNDAVNAAGNGEGRYWLGATNITTGNDGRGTFLVTFTNEATTGMVVTATATSTNGNTSGFSAPREITGTSDVPDAPEGLTASHGVYSDKVRLVWSPVIGATDYLIFRGARFEEESAVQIGESAVHGYDDTSATPGVTYYYRVKARNDYGSSGFSTVAEGSRRFVASMTTGGNGDYDGDGRADLAAYDAVTGTWKLWLSGDNYRELILEGWGGPDYTSVPADYDGDGKMDPAVYGEVTGTWKIWQSSVNYMPPVIVPGWGGPGYMPVPADYDGDGKADPAVYNESNGTWKVWQSSQNYGLVQTPTGWGAPGYVPVPADYDGDGKVDPCVFHPENGHWKVWMSASNYGLVEVTGFGGDGYVPVPADYDGDGKADPATYNEQDGIWRVWPSSQSYRPVQMSLGAPGYIPVPADYDGDGKTDLAVYNEATGEWRARLSGSNYAEQHVRW